MAKVTSRAFEKFLADYRDQLQKQIEARCAGFDTDPAAQAERMRHASSDLLWFGKTYFPHYIRDRVVNGRCVAVRPSALHRWIAEAFPEVLNKDESEHLAIAAPRGEAKSTWLLIFLVWCLVHRKKRYILYIMDVYEQAAVVVEALKVELETNPRLAQDFAAATGIGPVWKEGVIVTRGGVKVHARGAGQRVRGLKHGAYRPDLAFLDDIENDENVDNPRQRDKLTDWIDSAVEGLGEAGEKFDILYVGTLLHHDSTLKRTQDNPMWRAVTFRAIVDWPARMDLWEEWEEVLRNDGPEAAERYYQTAHAEMERGAVVSWPDKRPLLTLMKIRVRVGASAFDKEYQNDPVASDANFTAFTYWVQSDPEWLTFGAVDPSLGKHGRGRDPSAILVGGYSRRLGILDVIEASIVKRLPDKIIADMIAFQRRHACLMWFVEAVQFQEFLRTEAMKRAIKEGVPLPAMPVTPIADKDLRIATLQPPVADGLIRFHSAQRTLLTQLRHWPKADHDDGPDCLEILWKGAVSFSAPLEIRTGPRRGVPATFSDYVR